MEQRDFLKRQIEQVGRVMGKMLACLTGLPDGEAFVRNGIEVVDETMRRELDLDIDSLLAIEPDRLAERLIGDHGFGPENLDQMIDLLMAIADGMDMEDPRRDACFKRCLAVYDHLQQTRRSIDLGKYSIMERIRESGQ